MTFTKLRENKTMEFSLSVVNFINTLFIAAGVGICALCFLHITSSVHLRKEIRRYFQVFFLFLILYISTHLARQTMEGFSGGAVRTALYIVTFSEIVVAGFMAYMMSILVLYVSRAEALIKRLRNVLFALLCCHVAIVIVGAFFDLIYYFDSENNYHRGSGYLLSNLCPLIMIVINVVLLIKYSDNFKRRVKSAFWIYTVAPIAAIIIQGISYGVQFIIFVTVGAAVYMFSVIVRNQNEEYSNQQLESSRIETELNMASRIQSDMLPSIYPAFPECPEFDIFASMDPAKEVGGDFYDFFLVDDDHLCVVIADVSGKGVPAALFMMASKIILANNAMLGKSPANILTDANAAICANNREDMFVTVWLGILELSTGKLIAANAGHEYPALKKEGDSFKLMKDKHGIILGGMEGIRYKEYELDLKPGDKLFLYTDGVPEATNSEEELFGAERMLAALNEEPFAEPKDVLEKVRSAVDGFVNKAEQFDDLTMLCFEYTGPQKT